MNVLWKAPKTFTALQTQVSKIVKILDIRGNESQACAIPKIHSLEIWSFRWFWNSSEIGGVIEVNIF